MAIPHHHWTVYTRSKGQGAEEKVNYGMRQGGKDTVVGNASAIGALAYGMRAKVSARGEYHDYTDKDPLIWGAVLTPSNAPAWVYDTQKLAIAIEEREDRSTRPDEAQLIRGMVLGLPRELTMDQNIALVKRYCQDAFVSQGMVIVICIHNPKASDGGDNPHAHIYATMRDIGPDGFGNKRRDWNQVDFGIKDGGQHHRPRAMKDGLLNKSRAQWADYVNAVLEEAGSTARIDHRSLKAQASDLLPSVTMRKAQHASEDYEFVRRKKAEAADVRSYNQSIIQNVMRGVTGYLEGGIPGAVMATVGPMVANGMLSGFPTLADIPAIVTSRHVQPKPPV